MLNSIIEIFTVSFFGHRRIDHFNKVEYPLEELIINLLREHEYVDFLVGRNGDFDQLVSSTIRRVKRTFRDDNSCHTLVLPYETAEYRDNKESFHDYYDEIDMFGGSDVHFKAAIQYRNRIMVDRSDLVVFYLEHKSGGAYRTCQYAMKMKKEIIILDE